jgi:ABC-type transport system involved in multi-copper enzyme maturation permease subunit
MTAPIVALGPTTASAGRPCTLLGFRTVLRKELNEWARSPKPYIVAGLSILYAAVTTLSPLIARAIGEAAAIDLPTDPTTTVLTNWGGQSLALIAIVATMALLSGERERGTLAWSLTKPVSPTSILAAKFVAATAAFSVAAFLVPLILSVGIATVAYGAMPDLTVVAPFALLFLTFPAFYVALTLGLGAVIRSTAGVAGAAFAVMFAPMILGGFLPIVVALSPTSIGVWARAFAMGEPVPWMTPAAWVVSMVLIAVGSKLVFDRQEQ